MEFEEFYIELSILINEVIMYFIIIYGVGNNYNNIVDKNEVFICMIINII